MAWSPLLLSVLLIVIGFVLVLLTGGIVYVAFVRSFGEQTPLSATTTRQDVGEGKPLSLEYRVPSTIVFRPNHGLRLREVAIPGGSLDIELSTKRVDGWGAVEPAIVVEARGVGKHGAEAEESLRVLLTNLVSALSFSGNGWVGRLAADCDRERKEDDNHSCPRVADNVEMVRELDEESTGALLERIGAHPDADKVWEVLNCYRQALETWGMDQQFESLTHLDRGIWTMSGIINDEALSARVVHTDVDGENAHVNAASYLRSSIIRILELQEPFRSRLLEPPYDVPLGLYDATVRESARLRAQDSLSRRTLARPSEQQLDPEFGI